MIGIFFFFFCRGALNRTGIQFCSSTIFLIYIRNIMLGKRAMYCNSDLGIISLGMAICVEGIPYFHFTSYFISVYW
jgi:hypothetical protein